MGLPTSELQTIAVDFEVMFAVKVLLYAGMNARGKTDLRIMENVSLSEKKDTPMKSYTHLIRTCNFVRWFCRMIMPYRSACVTKRYLKQTIDRPGFESH